MKVAFRLDGQDYEAELLCRRRLNARVGWLDKDIPPSLAPRLKHCNTRPGWKTILLPVVGPGSVTLRVLPPPPRPTRAHRRALGVQTAELAKQLGIFVREQGREGRLQVICSHRGHYRGEREPELLSEGVILRQIAFFIGNDHTAATKAGVSDIAVVTRAEPKRAILLIEIEEDGSGTKPKAIIGDSLLPVLADRVDIREDNGTCYSISLQDAALWVGYHPRPGYDLSRTDCLANKLNDLLRKARSERGIGPNSIQLFNEPPDRLYDVILDSAKRVLVEWLNSPVHGLRRTSPEISASPTEPD